MTIIQSASASEMEKASLVALSFAEHIRIKGVAAIAPAISNGSIHTGRLSLNLDAETMASHLGLPAVQIAPSLLTLTTTFTCRRRGVETKIIAGDTRPAPDRTLIRALRNAHHWAEALKSGTQIKQISADNACSPSYARRVIPLATLSPRLQDAILTGKQPTELTLETLIRTPIPLSWTAQENVFGLTN